MHPEFLSRIHMLQKYQFIIKISFLMIQLFHLSELFHEPQNSICGKARKKGLYPVYARKQLTAKQNISRRPL